MTKTIEIIVSPQGETQLETKGFGGEECRQASLSIEQALGRSNHERLTSEFHQMASENRRLRQRG